MNTEQETAVAGSQPSSNGARPASAQPPPSVSVPPRIVQEMLGAAISTPSGAGLWRGFLLGQGLNPDASYTVVVANDGVRLMEATPA